LTAALVVDVARNSKHPLHSHFEWNDEVAGEAYRVDQARALIRTVRVRYVSKSSPEASDTVRAFTSVRTSTGHGYEPTLDVIADPVKRRIMFADMRREWVAYRRRYQGMEGFWDLIRKDLPPEEAGDEIDVSEDVVVL
jgi:hypothetical protein